MSDVLPHASWQRCRTHFAKNLSSMVPKTQWPTLSAMFHTIFQQPDAEAVWTQAREVVEFCQAKFPHVADYLEEHLDDVLAFTHTPKSVWTCPLFGRHLISSPVGLGRKVIYHHA